jgi:hypothetical protein
VVAVAALLLLTIIALGRRIVRQAGEIEAALDGAVQNTAPLFELGLVNHTLESVTRSIKAARGEQGPVDERNVFQRLAAYLPGASKL